MSSFIIAEALYSSEHMEMKKHFHMSHELIYVQEGKIELNIAHKRYILSDRQIAFISHLEEHSVKILSPTYRRYFIMFTPERLAQFIDNPKLMSVFKNRPEYYNHCVDATPITESIIAKMIREYHNRDDLSESVVACLLTELLTDYYRSFPALFSLPESISNPRILEIQAFIDQHFLQDIKISALAQMFFISPCYLSHEFKRLTGYSPKKYLLLNRLVFAKNLLLHTDLPIKEIAVQSGFPDSNAFIRSFKNECGLSPNQYRK